ncbi:hypothetical protein ACU4GG_31270 [Streptomyces nojiriensis]
MAGNDFGHALGLSRALSGLPLSPLVGGYGELVSAQQTLGLSHLGELLMSGGARLRVLDGVFRVERPGRRAHVNARVLRGMRAQRPEAAWLLDRLAGIQEEDPAALRRILLYQFAQLLHDHPAGHLPATAAGLGVDPAETAALVHAAAARPRLDAGQRAAAEGLEDDWRSRRVRAGVRKAALLPPGGGDGTLEARLAELADRAGAADAAIGTARRHEELGDADRASVRYEEAARLAGDCPRAVRGLVRNHRAEPGDPGPLESVLAPGGVEVRWPPGLFTGRAWRVVRLTQGEPAGSPLAEVAGRPHHGVLLDRDTGIGVRVRHVALPLGADGAVDGPPLIGAPVTVAPAVTGLRVADGNGRIEASWTAPAGTTGSVVTLTGPTSRRVSDATVQSLRFDCLEPGAYELTVRARYTAPDGRPDHAVLSSPVTTPATVHPWPAPVRAVTATPREGGGLDFHATGAEGAAIRLPVWPADPPAVGTELRVADLPPEPDWITPAEAGRISGDRAWTGLPPAGALVTVTAVAVLGERVVVGPGVPVEAPLPVTGLAARRTSPRRCGSPSTGLAAPARSPPPSPRTAGSPSTPWPAACSCARGSGCRSRPPPCASSRTRRRAARGPCWPPDPTARGPSCPPTWPSPTHSCRASGGACAGGPPSCGSPCGRPAAPRTSPTSYWSPVATAAATRSARPAPPAVRPCTG